MAPTYELDVTGDINVTGGVYNLGGTHGITDCFDNGVNHITITGGIITGLDAGVCP